MLATWWLKSKKALPQLVYQQLQTLNLVKKSILCVQLCVPSLWVGVPLMSPEARALSSGQRDPPSHGSWFAPHCAPQTHHKCRPGRRSETRRSNIGLGWRTGRSGPAQRLPPLGGGGHIDQHQSMNRIRAEDWRSVHTKSNAKVQLASSEVAHGNRKPSSWEWVSIKRYSRKSSKISTQFAPRHSSHRRHLLGWQNLFHRLTSLRWLLCTLLVVNAQLLLDYFKCYSSNQTSCIGHVTFDAATITSGTDHLVTPIVLAHIRRKYSLFASDRIMLGLFPPSSKVTFFRLLFPDACWIRWPTCQLQAGGGVMVQN